MYLTREPLATATTAANDSAAEEQGRGRNSGTTEPPTETWPLDQKRRILNHTQSGRSRLIRFNKAAKKESMQP
jgi:hypothetical protein